MNESYVPVERLSPDETFEAVHNLKRRLEENFIALGQLLSHIKQRNLYRHKGFESFREFVEAEYNIGSALAGKLVSVYELFVHELDMDDGTMQLIGLDRLSLVKPYVKKADWEVREDWLQKAEELPVNELKAHIKQIREQEKDTDRDIKDVLIEQYLEKMRTWFNCSAKELNFKLALYFQDADLEHVRKVVRERQRLFESELQHSKEDSQ